jgi:hypothetical protein
MAIMEQSGEYLPRTHNTDIYRIRAMKMLELRIAGMNDKEVAEKMDCSVNTVANHLQWAQRQGLTRKYENELISLASLAIDVYRKKLTGDEPDPYVAKDVIDKLIKLGDRFDIKESQQQELSLKAYIEQTKLDKITNERTEPKPTTGDIIVTVSPTAPSDTNSPAKTKRLSPHFNFENKRANDERAVAQPRPEVEAVVGKLFNKISLPSEPEGAEKPTAISTDN